MIRIFSVLFIFLLSWTFDLLANTQNKSTVFFENIRKQPKDSYDIVIAGAGTGGCGVAIQAARMGATVLLLEETDWLGGQSIAAGVTSQDYATPILGESGLCQEFYTRIHNYYKNLGISPATAYFYGALSFEPNVGNKLLYEMLAMEGGRLDLKMQSKIEKVLKKGNAIVGVYATVGGVSTKISCKILVDATELGDVIPLTGMKYRIGNCKSDSLNLEQEIQHFTWTATIKKYQKPISSKLLLPIPPGYDKIEKKFLRFLELKDGKVKIPPYATSSRPWGFKNFIGYRAMPDSKNLINSLPYKNSFFDKSNSGLYDFILETFPITRTHMNFGNDYPIRIKDIEDIKCRKETFRQAQIRTLQLLYFIQKVMGHSDWSVANDEGFDTNLRRREVDEWLVNQPDLMPFREVLYHFSAMIYARESRRIIGLETITAGDIERFPNAPKVYKNAVAIGDYMIDLHGSQQPSDLESDLDKPESQPKTAGERGYGPFQVPMGCFIPQKLDGFLAAEKNISQSRLANGSTRLQPSTLLMGQAVGALAAISIQQKIQPRFINAILVQKCLLDAGCQLLVTPIRDVEPRTSLWAAIQLCGLHGVLEPVNGWFGALAPVKVKDLENIQFKLFGKVMVDYKNNKMDNATKGEFLELIKNVKNVSIKFAPDQLSTTKVLSRGEAAMVLAELIYKKSITKSDSKRIVDLTTERIVPTPTIDDFTTSYLVPWRNWWMSKHHDFLNWNNSSPWLY
jgi:hypothetical protein